MVEAVVRLARDCVSHGFPPHEFAAMTRVSSDPRRARRWTDVGLNLREAGDWSAAHIVEPSDVEGWRDAGWDARDVVALEEALLRDVGYEALFDGESSEQLTATATAWRDLGMHPRLTIDCVAAGFEPDEAAGLASNSAATRKRASVLWP